MKFDRLQNMQNIGFIKNMRNGGGGGNSVLVGYQLLRIKHRSRLPLPTIIFL